MLSRKEQERLYKVLEDVSKTEEWPGASKPSRIEMLKAYIAIIPYIPMNNYASFLAGVSSTLLFIILALSIRDMVRVRAHTTLVPGVSSMAESLRINDEALATMQSNNARLKEISERIREEAAALQALNERIRTNQ